MITLYLIDRIHDGSLPCAKSQLVFKFELESVLRSSLYHKRWNLGGDALLGLARLQLALRLYCDVAHLYFKFLFGLLELEAGSQQMKVIEHLNSRLQSRERILREQDQIPVFSQQEVLLLAQVIGHRFVGRLQLRPARH